MIALLLLSLNYCGMAEDQLDKNLNLGWIGYLNLPSKIQKDGKKVKVKTPKMWEEWSENQGEAIDWFAKPEKDYQQKIKLYLMLEQTKAPQVRKTRRKIHLNK